MAAVPYLWSPFMEISLVSMIVYVWSREFPDARIDIYDLVSLKVWWISITLHLLMFVHLLYQNQIVWWMSIF